MKSGIPDMFRYSRSSRTKSVLRRSKQSFYQMRGSKRLSRYHRRSISQEKEDEVLEPVKIKWNEILEDEGVGYPVAIARTLNKPKIEPCLDVPKQPVVRVFFSEEEDPTDLLVEGEVSVREVFNSICSLFLAFPTFTVLKLIDCKLRAESILVLGGHLSDCTTVKELFLDLNPVSGENYSPLLASNALEVLSLRGCAISGVGAELLSEKLTQQKMQLKMLNLNTNLIDDKGAVALSKGLKWSNSLLCLSLAGNIIGSEGAISLFSVLKEFQLDETDMEKRKEKLMERTKLIMSIVEERKETYLLLLPPMTAVSSDVPGSRKSRRTDGQKSRRKSDTKNTTRSQKLLPSTSKLATNEEKTKSFSFRKDKDRISQVVSPVSRSRVSMKQAKSSVITAFSEITTGLTSKFDIDDTLDISEEETASEFFKLDSEDDGKELERKYKEKMLKKLYQTIAHELNADPALQDTFLNRVFTGMNGKVWSPGNLNLSHLNLAYNKIREDILESVLAVLLYQERRRQDLETTVGIKVLMLEGNHIPMQLLNGLESLQKSSVGVPELGKAQTAE